MARGIITTSNPMAMWGETPGYYYVPSTAKKARNNSMTFSLYSPAKADNNKYNTPSVKDSKICGMSGIIQKSKIRTGTEIYQEMKNQGKIRFSRY